jgi:hypothetical protein
MRTLTNYCLCLAAALVLAAVSTHFPSFGQFTSEIEGTVMDPTRAVIPAATITLRNMATGIDATVATSAAGYFRFASLPASTFKLTASAPGFRTTEISDLRLEGGETRTVNINL